MASCIAELNNNGKTISKNIAVDDIANVLPIRFMRSDVVGNDLRRLNGFSIDDSPFDDIVLCCSLANCPFDRGGCCCNASSSFSNGLCAGLVC